MVCADCTGVVSVGVDATTNVLVRRVNTLVSIVSTDEPLVRIVRTTVKVGKVEVNGGVTVLGILDVRLSEPLVSTEFELSVEPEAVDCGREDAEPDPDEAVPDEEGLDAEEELEGGVDPEWLLLTVDDVSETVVEPLALLDPDTDPE